MKPIAYTLSYIFPVLAVLTMFTGGWSLVLVPLFTFGLVPLIEVFVSGSQENFTKEEESNRFENSLFDWLLYLLVPIQVGVVGCMIAMVSTGHLQGWEILGAIVSVGICCGSFGINVAHELGHRNTKHEQWMAQILLWTSLYMHFFIEHNKGHHAKVATPDDPASSRKNQWLYAFWCQSVVGGWMSAWKIEARRLRKHRHPSLRLDNQMLQFQVIQLCTLVGIAWFAGAAACFAFIGSATFGFLLLETVNYVEHYGLARDQKANGRYERVRPHHSWNANHPLGRLLLFELTRHSDHHAYPGRKYPTLRHFDYSPQLPTGYPGMILLALCPPLFFAVMNPCLEREEKRMEEFAA
ncbi:MAG: alkane 1-monooxygenase [Deltaproteobacteria bacterium]|nr:alkane 1-monooxygenase [Deltaproteobacteria bacterium]